MTFGDSWCYLRHAAKRKKKLYLSRSGAGRTEKSKIPLSKKLVKLEQQKAKISRFFVS